MSNPIALKDNIKVVTSNNFLRATGLANTTLKARKLLYLAMAQCKKTDTGFLEYSISIPEFASFMGVDASNVYDSAKDIARELMDGKIEIETPSNRNSKYNLEIFHLFKKCTYTDNANIVFQMSEEMTPILLNLKRDFTSALLNDFAKMRSNHSIEIWHLIQKEFKARKLGPFEKIIFTMYIDELKRVTGTTNIYKKTSHFKARVWEKALEEIWEQCGVKITYTDIKKSRKVVGFKCTAQHEVYIGTDALTEEFKESVKKKAAELHKNMG